MTLPLEPRPVGDPAAMHAFAGELRARAMRLADQAEALRSRSRAATFAGPAATRFDGFMEAEHRTLLVVGGELSELATRIRSQAYQVQADIAAWERYRDRLIQQRITTAGGDTGER